MASVPPIRSAASSMRLATARAVGGAVGVATPVAVSLGVAVAGAGVTAVGAAVTVGAEVGAAVEDATGVAVAAAVVTVGAVLRSQSSSPHASIVTLSSARIATRL